MLHTIELKVDELDFQAINNAISRRQGWGIIPDTDEPDANLAGRLIAEICRGWLEYRDVTTEDDDESDD